mmetsp:Transcript_15791/g.26400  ORF Transcript_15791/g.26400 Transcript_15791/m.26400 type:complete len:409 (-) Transcript_15791:344-1570(-)|eukprot:CAMPEP_0114426740 /NCGR_PEP_ID=MMETSP0103-20121206/7962_1 /TAXON_ID=37642 ORGANISM="Paraphysomonas imperforata, Strain PA2" /NCGR_SAMPLE_ID=MMETSP0103 /ASSEMBLY_ACC=CAM_ASM_000201 /LENGTH=408 /DNA_ID=CAMNT_0001595727 /DNA_START=87 /DNA_END=1313 /DNA_ORIENTATION=+
MADSSKKPADDLSDGMAKLNVDSDTGEIGARNRRAKEAADSNGNTSSRKDKSSEGRSETINYDAQRMVGHGSFGAVFQAKVVETGDIVAIKKVLQDRRFKNRELQIMRQLSNQKHPYVVTLKHYFVSKGQKADEVYLNLVLEYIPETIYSVAKTFTRAKETMPLMSVKIYMYQLARALAHIHGIGICHRDIKPQNLLVDPSRQVLKLCDFGSAKALVAGEPNVAYICSRYYRAPELIFGFTEYSTAIDVWSGGCVLAELLLGTPIFPGSSGVDQLVEIIKILGTPTREELHEMNPNYQEFKFPNIRAPPWASVFKANTDPQALDLASKYLTYKPKHRVLAIESCMHPFFDELREPSAKAMVKPEGGSTAVPTPLPSEMFEFTSEELQLMPEVKDSLIPAHLKKENGGA